MMSIRSKVGREPGGGCISANNVQAGGARIKRREHTNRQSGARNEAIDANQLTYCHLVDYAMVARLFWGTTRSAEQIPQDLGST